MSSPQEQDDSLPSVDADPLPPREEVTDDQSMPEEDPSPHASRNVDSETATQSQGTNYVATGSAASAQTMSLPYIAHSPEALSTFPAESTQPANGSSFQGGPTVSETAVPVNIAVIRSPHSDWRFNIFLSTLADAMTSDDFRKIKFIFKGGVGKKALEKVDDPRDLFTLLETRGFLSKDNLLYLQKALYELGRKDLIKDVVEYARNIPNTLVCYPASNEPVNGYMHVKWHIEGKNFQNCTRSDIQAIRVHIAEVLCIPPEFVLIAGIEPSSSLLLTLMIPVLHVEILLDMLRKKENFAAFSQHGIDRIEINGEVFAVTDKQNQVQSEQQKQLLHVYKELQDTEKYMQSAELRCLDMEKNVKALKLDLKAAETMVASLKPKVSNTNMEQEYGRRLEQLKSQLDNLKKDKIDPKHVFSLMECHSALLRILNKWSHLERERALEAEVSNIQKVNYDYQLRLARLEFMLSSTPLGSRPQIVPEVLEHMSMSKRRRVSILQFALSDLGIHILKTISTKLSKGDIDKLIKTYNLEEDDIWTKELNTDTNKILEAVFHKTANNSTVPLIFENFVETVLMNLGRNDLVEILNQEMAKAARESASSTASDSNSEIMPTLKRMSEQINFIYNKMETVSRLPSTDAFCLDPLKVQQMQPPQPWFSNTEESKQY